MHESCNDAAAVGVASILQMPNAEVVAMKVREVMTREMKGYGFKIREEHTFLPYQYFVVFEIA